jgi:amidohydrolase
MTKEATMRLLNRLMTAVIAAAGCITVAAAQTPSPALLAKVNAAIDADTARLTDIFKDLHQNPEIAFTETRTAAIVAKELAALGFEVTTGIGKTGVVGVLKNGPGKTLWFRADMDANAVKEVTGLPYAATKPQKLADGSEISVMHACGHDAHVTWMLGLAKAMVALKAEWTGTLVVYGQPAEEVGLGAQAMVKDGLWERGFPKPDFALSSHTAPGPLGYVSNSPGVRMAGVDQLDITFTGIGGHGSTPQMTIDPVVMAAQAVMAYQTIISRTVDPQSAAVLTVGSIQAGRDNNVIPQTAELKLNLRWLQRDVRDTMIRRIDEINNGIAISAGLPLDKLPTRTLTSVHPGPHPFRIMKGNSGPLVNDPALVARVNPALTALLGDGKVINNFPTVMGSEDFQDAMDPVKAPYVFLLIGVAPVERFLAAQKAGMPFPYSNHNPDFFVDLAAIPIGAKANVVSALTLLGR